MSLAPGTHLGAYEILSALGTGGMGSACGCGERARRVELEKDAGRRYGSARDLVLDLERYRAGTSKMTDLLRRMGLQK